MQPARWKCIITGHGAQFFLMMLAFRFDHSQSMLKMSWQAHYVSRERTEWLAALRWISGLCNRNLRCTFHDQLVEEIIEDRSTWSFFFFLINKHCIWNLFYFATIFSIKNTQVVPQVLETIHQQLSPTARDTFGPAIFYCKNSLALCHQKGGGQVVACKKPQQVDII